MDARSQLLAWPLAAALLACGGTRASSQGPVLSRVDVMPAGAGCPGGGKAVRSGVDANGDGVLQDAEVSATELVCLEAAKVLLLRAEAEPAGANCPAGGQAVKAGLDANGDGILGDAEVERVSYVCGAAPEAPPAVLTRQAALAADPSCSGAGTRVDSGRDRDHDGTLSDAEVERTVVVCDAPAAPPAPVLVRQGPARYGTDCPGSGTVVRAGPDADGDGLLSDAEVTRTAIVCSETLPAFTVRNAADLALVEKATRIAGDLVIQGSDLVSVRVPAAVVDGSIVIDSNPKLQEAFFTARLLGGRIAVRHNPVLHSCVLDTFLGAVQHLAGLELQDDPALKNAWGLERVATIAGDVRIEATGLALLPSLEALAYVGGDFTVANNPALVGWGSSSRSPSPLPGTTVSGNVHFEANAAWGDDRFPFGYVGRRLDVWDDGVGKVSRLSLHALAHVGGLDLERNAALFDVDMPMLTVVDGDLVLRDNAILSTGYGVNRLREVAGSVTVAGNARGETLGILYDVVHVGGSIRIADNPALRYAWLGSLATASDLTVQRNAALSAIGRFGPASLYLDDLASVGGLTLEANPALAQLSLPALSAADVLTVRDNVALPTCAAQALAKQLTRGYRNAAPVVEIAGNLGDGTSCP